MKRIGNLYGQITNLENLRLAESNARKGKSRQHGVRMFDKNPDAYLLLLHESLINGNFKTSEYKTFSIHEPKERLVYRLPYYPDRIVHHAVMNILKPYFHKWFTADTFANIEGRGIHSAADAVKQALRNRNETMFCLKIDIKKYYPNVSGEILKDQLRRKFKDGDLLSLLDEIIDSSTGLPIGNYLSQYFANFYLTGFDHWIKQDCKVKHYFRYADDMVFLAPTKEELHELLFNIRTYFYAQLRLEVKQNYQVFPVESRGINFVGYVFYHTHTLLRPSIKKRFAKAMSKKNPKIATIAAYKGWAKHCNSKHLQKKLFPNEHNNI